MHSTVSLHCEYGFCICMCFCYFSTDRMFTNCRGTVTQKNNVLNWFIFSVHNFYSDHQYARIVKTQKWTILVDPDCKSNWYLRERKRLGCPGWIFFHILLPIYVLVCVLTFLVLELRVERVFNIMLTVMYAGFPVIIAIICAYFWRTFPKLYDTLFIRSELKLLIAFCALYACLWCISLAITHDGVLPIPGNISLGGFYLWVFTNYAMMLTLLYCHIVYPQRKMERADPRLRTRSSRSIHVSTTSTDFDVWESVSSVIIW